MGDGMSDVAPAVGSRAHLKGPTPNLVRQLPLLIHRRHGNRVAPPRRIIDAVVLAIIAGRRNDEFSFRACPLHRRQQRVIVG